MPYNIFTTMAPILEELKFPFDYHIFIEFMGKYHADDWIYPAVLHRNLSIDIKSIYVLLEKCRISGLINRFYEIYCPNCQKYSGMYYQNVLEIPEYITCSYCDKEIISPIKYAVVIYRMNKNE